MTALKGLLPPPAATTTASYDHSNDPWFKQRFGSAEAQRSAAVVKPKPVPPYLKRQGFVPRKVEEFGEGEFGEGGAFPEIHIAQYPLGMGRDKLSKPGTNILPNEDEEMDYANEKEEKLQKEIEETTAETKAALEKIVNVRLSTAQPKNIAKQSIGSKIIKYMPSQKAAAFNSGAKARIIRMAEMPVDPLKPPKFKHKRVPRPSGSPPVPVMHSPPRPVTVKDLKDWKIPPCISNWKNQKGYTIPLDKRLAAEGKILQDLGGLFLDNLAKLHEALYVAEQKAREGIAMRKNVQDELLTKEKEKKEQDLRILAQRARSERRGATAPPSMPSTTEQQWTMMREGIMS
ncbi:PREDICTED: SNW, partial [Prunus dulcis]